MGVPKKCYRQKSAAEPAPSYLTSRTKTLLFIPRAPASALLWGLLQAAWWVVPRPAAGSTSPSAAPGRGRFLHVCCTLGSSPIHYYHRGWPRGVFVASCMTLKLHCGTCSDFFGIWSTCCFLFCTSGDFGAPVWHSWASFCHPWGLVVNFLLTLCGVIPNPLDTFKEKPWKR